MPYRYPTELRERAVRMVLEASREGVYSSEWAAICAVAQMSSRCAASMEYHRLIGSKGYDARGCCFGRGVACKHPSQRERIRPTEWRNLPQEIYHLKLGNGGDHQAGCSGGPESQECGFLGQGIHETLRIESSA